MADAVDSTSNPFLETIKSDLQNRDKWARRDRQIQKRRMGERPVKKSKPYPGAPNFVVPIVDDTVREKTDQEITMIENAKLLAYFIPLTPNTALNLRTVAQLGFDTLYRYMMGMVSVMERCLDTKNARGYAVVKIVEEETRWGLVPTIIDRDPSDVVVAADAPRDMQKHRRITDIYRFDPDDFQTQADKNPTWNKAAVKAAIEAATNDTTKEANETAFETIKNLVGVTTDGDAQKRVVLFEYWHYAGDWTVDKAKGMYPAEVAARIIKGRKCKMLFSPQLPDQPIAIHPWRDERERVEERPVYAQDDAGNVILDPATQAPVVVSKESVTVVEDLGDRRWPYVQCPYENRTTFFYDSRGIGQLTMDEQIAATAVRNGKHTLMDYYQLPLFTGPIRNSPQMTFEPGSFLPEGVSRVDPVDVPAGFDFTVDQFKREAARRCGVSGLYEFSDRVTETRKVEKTATEIQREGMRGDMLSSASVRRFVGPWGEVFLQLWEGLKRNQVRLPLVVDQQFQGESSLDVYSVEWLIVPAANARTLNPDMQFLRDKELSAYCLEMSKFGVVVDPQMMAEDTISHADPEKARWIRRPDRPGPQGQIPVYQALGDLSGQMKQVMQMLQATQEAVKQVAALADHTAERTERQDGGGAG